MEGLRVLVVDSDEEAGLAVGRLLRRISHAASVATSGSEALDSLAVLPFDAVLCEHTLPDMNTATLVAQLHAERPSLPVVVMSDDVRSPATLAALQQGARTFLPKPVELPWLALVLERLRYASEQGTQATVEPNELALRFAHAVNNPLSAIYGLVQLLLAQQDLPPAVYDDLELIADNTLRLSKLVNNLAHTEIHEL